MKPFTYERANSVEAAAKAAASVQGARFIAGGTNLLDLMKLEIENVRIFFKKPLHLEGEVFSSGSPNGSRMVPDGPPMLWGPSGITRDVSGTSVMPLDVCVKVANG